MPEAATPPAKSGPAAPQQSDQYRLEDGRQHVAGKQNLSRSAIPSTANQARRSHRHQGHGRQVGPLRLPHAALRDEIRGPRSSLLRPSTPRVKDQAPQVQSRKARIPSHPNTGGGLTSSSFWRDDDLADRVIEVVRVVTGLPVGFAFVPPENDHAAVLVGFRGHDERNQAAQGIIALPYIGRIAGQTCKAAAESAVHVVVLIGRNPVVIGHAVLREIECQPLKARSFWIGGWTRSYCYRRLCR